jgi:hypothetical protein
LFFFMPENYFFNDLHYKTKISEIMSLFTDEIFNLYCAIFLITNINN